MDVACAAGHALRIGVLSLVAEDLMRRHSMSGAYFVIQAWRRKRFVISHKRLKRHRFH
jgi:hypothetical protein